MILLGTLHTVHFHMYVCDYFGDSCFSRMLIFAAIMVYSFNLMNHNFLNMGNKAYSLVSLCPTSTKTHKIGDRVHSYA